MPTYDPNKQTAGPLIPATNAQGYQTGGFVANPAYAAQGGAPIAAFDPATGATLAGASAPAQSSAPSQSGVSDRMREFAIGLYDGSITSQDQVNPTGSFGSQFNAQGQRTSGAPSEVFSRYYGTPAPTPMRAAGTSPVGGASSASAPQGSLAGASSSASGSGGGFDSGISDYEKELPDYIERPVKPQTADEIAAKEISASQEQINNINQNYNNQLVDQGRVNDMRTAETNAMSVLSGLTGSSEASARGVATAGVNAQENKKIQDQRALALSTLYSAIRKDAQTEARQQAQDYRTNAKDALTSIQGRREANMAKAEKSVVALASAGTTADNLKSMDPQTYQYLADAVGGEEQLKAMFVLNRPQETIIDKKFENGKYIIAYKTPDGGVRIETLDTGLPADVKTQVIDNNMYSSEDGGLTWKIAIAGKPDQLKQLQIQKAQLEVDKARKEMPGTGEAGSQTQQVALVLNSLKDAKALSGASGRSGARKAIEGVTVGATDYTNLTAKANSIRANMLTLTSDPQIKKFFGPQMSNSDVQFMMSAGTTLNPELQSPAELKGEIERLEKIFSDKTKWKNIDWGTIDSLTTGKSGGQVTTAPDGTQVIITD